MMIELVAGMLVQSKHKDMPLRSGAEWYPAAVVAQVEPLVLISEEGDMLWGSNMDPDDYEPCGVASTYAKIQVNDRIERTGETITPLPITDAERAVLWFDGYGGKTVEAFVTIANGGRHTCHTTIEEMYQMFKIRMDTEKAPW